MTKRKNTRNHSHKEKGAGPKPTITTATNAEPAGMLDQSDTAVTAASHSVENQAAILSNGRIPTAQRQAMAAHIGQVGGNQYLQRLISRLPEENEATRPVDSSALNPAHTIQKWDSPEHMRLGDTTGVMIDIGDGVQLTFGQVVALAGDEFGSLEELMAATKTDDGRAMIRAHLERASIPGTAAAMLPAPTDKQRSQASSEYITLAMDNSEHFAGGGTAVENWLSHHAQAIDKAIQAGLYMDNTLLNEAHMAEAFGDHFLTDAFSSGHIRVPRQAITDYYVNEFAPSVVDHLIDHLRERLVDDIYDQVEGQTVINEAAWVLGGIVGGLGVRAYIRRKIRNAINTKLDEAFTAAGGRQQVIRYLGLGIAGIISGAMHDMENEQGLWVVSGIHPEPWLAYGDDELDKNPEHRRRVEEAVAASLADLQTAYDIGLEQGQALYNLVDLAWLPETVYFGFDSDALTPEAAGLVDTVADYLQYNRSTLLTLMGHADPIGDNPYNDDLSSRRAHQVANRLLSRGVDSDRLQVESMGEEAPVTTSRSHYHLNRRVEFVYATGADIDDHGPENTAYENAQQAALAQIGPAYAAEAHFPHAAAGLNNELPEWHWGAIPASFRSQMATWIQHYINQYATDALAGPALDPMEVEGYTVSPRPVAQAIVNDIVADPIGFLSRAFGRSAG